MYITRRERFSAAHRLINENFNEKMDLDEILEYLKKEPYGPETANHYSMNLQEYSEVFLSTVKNRKTIIEHMNKAKKENPAETDN